MFLLCASRAAAAEDFWGVTPEIVSDFVTLPEAEHTVRLLLDVPTVGECSLHLQGELNVLVYGDLS